MLMRALVHANSHVKHKTTKSVLSLKTYLPTKIGPLDRLLGGGLPSSDVLIVAGEIGTGKSIFAEQICFTALSLGYDVLLECLDKKPDEVLAHMRSFGWDASPFLKRSFTLTDMVNRTGIADELMQNVVKFCEGKLGRHLLVVTDSISAVKGSESRRRVIETFRDRTSLLKSVGAFGLVIAHGSVSQGEISDTLRGIFDGLLHVALSEGKLTIQHIFLEGGQSQARPISIKITTNGIQTA
ncbi:MAG: RAD55 family ATPase [Candidatus Bathyarchaeia archaeon]